MNIKIRADYRVKAIAGRTVAGSSATILERVGDLVIAEIKGLAPYGHSGGKLVLAPEDYEQAA